MSRISKILDKPEHIVTRFMAELEEKNGFPSHDARFLAENIQKIRIKTAELGLDPNDTTGEELYQALQAKFQKNSRLFDIYFAAESADFDAKVSKAVSIISSMLELPQHWVLKNTAAKNILRQQPPKRVMKRLGYRSVESMLKRGRLGEIYLAAQQVEPVAWHKAHNKLVSRLGQMDFEFRTMQLCQLNSSPWSQIDGPSDFTIADYGIGAIGIWPSSEIRQASLLALTLLLMEEIDDGNLKLSCQLGSVTSILDWWTDMDHLVAELADEHISLNLHDNALNLLFHNNYEERLTSRGRQAFWQELLSRYHNLPPAEALFDDSVRQKVAGLKFKAPEPAYEFAEEFDG